MTTGFPATVTKEMRLAQLQQKAYSAAAEISQLKFELLKMLERDAKAGPDWSHGMAPGGVAYPREIARMADNITRASIAYDSANAELEWESNL